LLFIDIDFQKDVIIFLNYLKLKDM